MTNVTLTKAHQLEKQALEVAKKLGTKTTTLNISVYEEPSPPQIDEKIGIANKKFQETIADARELTKAAFLIRSLASRERHEAGIDQLLLERAENAALQQILSRHVDGSTDDEDDTIRSLRRRMRGGDNPQTSIIVEKIKTVRQRLTSAERGYGLQEQVPVDVLTEEDKERFADQLMVLRNRKTAILDELQHKNYTHHIALPSEVVNCLKRHKIAV